MAFELFLAETHERPRVARRRGHAVSAGVHVPGFAAFLALAMSHERVIQHSHEVVGPRWLPIVYRIPAASPGAGLAPGDGAGTSPGGVEGATGIRGGDVTAPKAGAMGRAGAVAGHAAPGAGRAGRSRRMPLWAPVDPDPSREPPPDLDPDPDPPAARLGPEVEEASGIGDGLAGAGSGPRGSDGLGRADGTLPGTGDSDAPTSGPGGALATGEAARGAGQGPGSGASGRGGAGLGLAVAAPDPLWPTPRKPNRTAPSPDGVGAGAKGEGSGDGSPEGEQRVVPLPAEGGGERPTRVAYLSEAVAAYQRTYDAYPNLPEWVYRMAPSHRVYAEICVSTEGKVVKVDVSGTNYSEIVDVVRGAINTWRYRPRLVRGQAWPFCHPMYISYVSHAARR